MRSLIKPATVIGLPLFLGACVGAMAPSSNVARVGIGQSAALGTIRLVPLQLIEDSRCPVGTQCASPGQLRVRVTVQPPQGPHQRTLTLGQPELISGGTLLLEEARPHPVAGERPVGSDYRFTFRFTVPRTH
ncbi:MAG: hypothetical protein J7493_12840 [Porphyrobacter sp.]|nr:hypothetical protein [Porphyrobacter sp.]